MQMQKQKIFGFSNQVQYLNYSCRIIVYYLFYFSMLLITEAIKLKLEMSQLYE